jgi:hypothetical protein
LGRPKTWVERRNTWDRAIASGSIKTEFSKVNWSNPERKANRIKDIELKRFGEPEEVVGIALFLASEASSFVTGEITRVEGLMSCTNTNTIPINLLALQPRRSEAQDGDLVTKEMSWIIVFITEG